MLLCTTGLSPVLAQKEAATPPAPAQGEEEALFSSLTWRNIGPNRGGRSISAVGSTARPNEYYFAATGGGLWKTTDGGTSWSAVTDGKIDTGAVGGVAVCEANPDVVYLTTGETQLRGNVLPGNGVYRSADAGKTWTKVGLADVQNFSRVRIHPKDCDTVWVGGFGHYGAANPERGVFKTKDGGKSWRKVLYRDPRSGAVDISVDFVKRAVERLSTAYPAIRMTGVASSSWRKSRTMASVPAGVAPAFSPRWPASWITGPSAIGSVKGTPISMRSAPAPGRPRRMAMLVAGSGS